MDVFHFALLSAIMATNFRIDIIMLKSISIFQYNYNYDEHLAFLDNKLNA